ncbi:MAG TPA: hypothetical protein VMU04_10175 [Candidatus Acidoferrum sp.]|nr:hypothetical protein [Candidatus Acidoferrum sp.]
MSDLVPFFLHEAVLSLYPLGDDDGILTDAAVWQGALANGLRASLEYEELLGASSGDKYQRAHHVDERHVLEIERTWLLRGPVLADPGHGPGLDAVPGRNQRYALEMVWFSQGYWYRRWYWGVTARLTGWDSVRTLEFGQKQSWRAERFTEEGGYVPQPIYVPPGGGGGSSNGGTVPPPVVTPLPEDTEQAIGFFHENPLVAGEYLLGRYRWPVAVTCTAARVVAFAPQGSPVVLGLEVNGVLTGDILTLPVGTANTEVTVDVTLAVSVPPLADVRWKILSAPDAADSAWQVALGMQVRPL